MGSGTEFSLIQPKPPSAPEQFLIRSSLALEALFHAHFHDSAVEFGSGSGFLHFEIVGLVAQRHDVAQTARGRPRSAVNLNVRPAKR